MRTLTKLALGLLCAASLSAVNATHFVGGEISYKCVGGMNYELTMVAFGDCLAIPLGTTWNVNATTVNCSNSFNVVLPLVDTATADLGCANWSSACSGGTDPGMRVHLYRDTITLPINCDDWVFSTSNCCRYGSINNLNNAQSASIYVETQLNSVLAPCNSSPVFQEAPLTFICAGDDYCISNTAFDPDGDSLVFSMAPVYDAANTPVAYAAGFSVSNPFASSTGHLFDPLTGNHCFNPSALGSFAVGYRVEEYRNGVLIGSVHRDFAVNALNCTGTTLSVEGTVTDSSGNPLTAGDVILYQYGMNSTSNTVIDTVMLGPGGSYSFSPLPLGQYIVKAVPDSATYPNLASSYHRSTYYWPYADPFSSICDDTLTVDITAVHQGNLAGSGYLEGYLGDLGLRSSFGVPWVGQEVFLETWPMRSHVQTVRSDAAGIYRFQNVPNGTYRIVVDRPGNPMTGYYIVTVNGASNHTGLDYAGDAIGIHPFIATGVVDGEVNLLSVSPNPVLAGSTLVVDGLADGVRLISFVSLDGKILSTAQAVSANGRVELSVPEIAGGTYLLMSDVGRIARIHVE